MDVLLNIKEASTYLKCSKWTIYRIVKRGEISFIRHRRKILFKEQDLETYVNKDRIEARLNFNLKKAVNNLTKMPPVAIDKAKGGQEVARKKTRHNYGYGAVYIRKTKLGIPRFYIDHYDRNRKRIQKLVKNASNWQEAHEALKYAILKEHYSECGIKENKQSIKFKEFVKMFIENYSRVNKRSWKDDFYRLRKFVSFFGNVYLQDVNALDIEKFKSEKIEEGLTKTTVNHYLKILKRLFIIAIEWRYARENPVRRIKLYSEKDTQKERILSEEEEVRLLEAALGHLRPILVVALNTGMRRGEILNLRWEQVDLEQRIIQVINTKSGRNRVIPVNDALFGVLKGLKKNSEYVFPNPETGGPYRTVRRSFENACQRTKIKGLRFHDLRHTFASRLVERGVDIVRVKELLGHSSVKVTERYTHSNQEERKRAVELLCEKTPKKARKLENLLHNCDMEKEKNERVFVSSLFSVN